MLPIIYASTVAHGFKRKKKKEKKPMILQDHHICYEPPVIVRVRRSIHHFIITPLSRYNGLLAGEKKAIKAILKAKKTLRLPRRG